MTKRKEDIETIIEKFMKTNSNYIIDIAIKDNTYKYKISDNPNIKVYLIVSYEHGMLYGYVVAYVLQNEYILNKKPIESIIELNEYLNYTLNFINRMQNINTDLIDKSFDDNKYANIKKNTRITIKDAMHLYLIIYYYDEQNNYDIKNLAVLNMNETMDKVLTFLRNKYDPENIDIIGNHVILNNSYIDIDDLSLDFKTEYFGSIGRLIASVQFKINGIKKREWWEGLSVEGITDLEETTTIIENRVKHTTNTLRTIEPNTFEFNKYMKQNKFEELVYQIDETKIPKQLFTKLKESGPYVELVDFNPIVYLITALLHGVELTKDDIIALNNSV